MTPKKIRKAVIPVAGLGTRMLPASKAIPKEMLPVVDKPIIQYIVQECAAAGINEIVLVTHSSKNSIENHFDRSFELETMLERRVKRQLLQEMQSVCPERVKLIHIRQGEAKGLGHAINCAYPVIGDQPFAVVLPDVLIDEASCDLNTDNLADMIAHFEQDNLSRILVEPVPQQNVDQYGIVNCVEAPTDKKPSVAMTAIVEKPAVDEAPSNLAVVGRYVFSAKIWPLLAKTPLGAGGEIQLSDAIALLLEKEPVHAYHMVGKSHDCGNKLGYMKANVEYAMRHPELGAAFKTYLKSLSI